ncbi:unnamed protein product [Gadus morhua 'NCC']
MLLGLTERPLTSQSQRGPACPMPRAPEVRITYPEQRASNGPAGRAALKYTSFATLFVLDPCALSLYFVLDSGALCLTL